MASVSAYIPCFNNAATVLETARSIQEQSPRPEEIFVVDDGSTDDSREKLRAAGFRVVEMGVNSGRGPVRARAIVEARGEFVLSCDATMQLAPDFLERVLPHLDDPKAAAVFGKVVHRNPTATYDRWRARHLFKQYLPRELEHGVILSTWGVLMRREAVMAVGNFNSKLRHTEDIDLSERLAANGWDVIFEPAAQVYPLLSNSLAQLMERFWRWHIGVSEKFGPRHYLRQISYSVRTMARMDLQDGDVVSAFISLLTPHYYLWRRLRRMF